MFIPHAPNGLARAAVRFKPSSFIGTFVALLMAAAIVSACGILTETSLRASVPADRYAKAPVVVAADQKIHLRTGSGDSTEETDVLLPDTARLPESLVARAASAPGAATAIGDVTYSVRHDGTPSPHTAGAPPPSPAPGWSPATHPGPVTSSSPRAPGAGPATASPSTHPRA